MADLAQSHLTTRHLAPENVPAVAPRGTGPLDYLLPWVIKLRVVGTASIIETEVSRSMLLGRSDDKSTTNPDVDLGPFNGYQMGVSRQHANISARNSRITIRDLNSANGTFLNGGKLEPGKEYKLQHNDTIRLGKLELQCLFVVMPSSYEKNDTPFNEVDLKVIGSGQYILVVDDDEKVANTMASIIREAGFDVGVAHRVSDAMTLIERRMPDVIIMELLLPDMSGLEIMDFVHTKEGGQDLPFVVVTSATGGYQMGQAIAAGAEVFITKPVGVDELMSTLAKLIKQPYV